MRTVFALTFAAAVASQSGVLAGVGVGDPAAAVEPKEWLNTKETVSWAKLKGRVILLEKWGTY